MTRPPADRLLVLVLGAVLLVASGCANRPHRHQIIDRRGMQVELVHYTDGLFKTEPQGFAHPAIISKERLMNILGAIEIETREAPGATIRRPGIHAEMIEPIAEALSEGLRKASPDEEVGIKAVRKEMNLGIFHTLYLTTMLAWVKDTSLYVQLHRSEWPIPQAKEGKPLPEPLRDTRPMDYRVVSGEFLYFAGPQTLEIAFQNDVFKTAYHLPGTTKGETRRREVLMQSPIPSAERKSDDGAGISLDQLTPDQLRALADLEDDRKNGRITEQAYQRARRELLRPR